MDRYIINQVFSQQNSVKEVVDQLRNNSINQINLDGLYGSSKAVCFSSAMQNGVQLIVMNNKEDAQYVCNDIYSLVGDDNVYFFPTSTNKISKLSTSKESSQKVQRSAAINAINTFSSNGSISGVLILVTYPNAIIEKIINQEELVNNILKIKKGDNLSHEFIKETLLLYNFERVDFVSEPGQFALRGGIIDLFSYSSDKPFRIDFFGNEVESIREFDIDSQRSLREMDIIEIFPNIFDEQNFEQSKSVSIFEYLKDNKVTLWVDDLVYLSDQLHLISNTENLLSQQDINILIKDVINTKKVVFNSQNSNSIKFNISPQPSFNKNFDLLIQDLNTKIKSGYKVVISSENLKQFERLKSIFQNYFEKNGGSLPKFEELNYSIHTGFVDNNVKLCLYTDHQIFDRYHRVKIKREVARSERLTINELNAFQIGDYIVHIDHGVGIFGGLVKTNLNGNVQEAVKLIYKDNDVIFVSIHSIHRISRYKSKDSASPKIYKLGTGAWDKLKTQTKKKVKDIAKDLIKLYSERKQSKGFPFSGDTYLQQELEASFIYEDTPDQLKTTQAIKEDMEKPYPMDRLVCGDVGFGKTEVAIRSAFKAVADSKQVAVLVPTTILALQHYKTFKNRLKDFPCNIEYLSRLKTAKEIREVAERLKNGKIDIIIGTHRLLNKEIEFKDLGLLIIDEEQKFGVAAKERLRHIKNNVDTLTLSATPIPRTLQFSLLGARDLSVINTPPPNRLPVQTEIIDFNEDVIKDAIQFELDRGGQVYFIHNRVEDILAVEDIIKRIVPGAKTCVGHGQMDPKELEEKIIDFIAGDYDVLVATTIVENGIDVPNANTIIINQAQNFGLSDLHQLRGRVGRSNQKAFCYLIVPPMISVTDEARRRLRAIEAFSDLGSGFNIAMQDLDIRGAGNMLGGEQSGFIADMGFETYQRILSEAFVEMKQEQALDENAQEEDIDYKDVNYVTDCSIDTDLELLIPDTYIPQIAEKIRLYKELDALTNLEDLNKFIEELTDRFGPIPKQLKELTYIVQVRWLAVALGFERIVMKNGIILAYFVSNQQSSYYSSPLFAAVLNFLNSSPGKYKVKEQNHKLLLRVEGVKSVESLYNLLYKMKCTILN